VVSTSGLAEGDLAAGGELDRTLPTLFDIFSDLDNSEDLGIHAGTQTDDSIPPTLHTRLISAPCELHHAAIEQSIYCLCAAFANLHSCLLADDLADESLCCDLTSHAVEDGPNILIAHEEGLMKHDCISSSCFHSTDADCVAQAYHFLLEFRASILDKLHPLKNAATYDWILDDQVQFDELQVAFGYFDLDFGDVAAVQWNRCFDMCHIWQQLFDETYRLQCVELLPQSQICRGNCCGNWLESCMDDE